MDSFHSDSTWQTFPLTFHFTLLPFLVVLFHMPKHFNYRLPGFLWPGWIDGARVLQSRTICRLFFWKAKQGEREERSNGGGGDFEDSDKGHVLGLLRDSHYFPFSTEAMMRMKHFLSLKVAICPFNACVMKAWHLFIHPPCTNLIIFFFYSLADNSHFISIKLCLFTAICCCNVLELSA